MIARWRRRWVRLIEILDEPIPAQMCHGPLSPRGYICSLLQGHDCDHTAIRSDGSIIDHWDGLPEDLYEKHDVMNPAQFSDRPGRIAPWGKRRR